MYLVYEPQSGDMGAFAVCTKLERALDLKKQAAAVFKDLTIAEVDDGEMIVGLYDTIEVTE